MIRHLLLLLILAGPAISQPVTIRSGDHDSFVRLVLSIPEGTPWRVGRIEGGIGIALEGLSNGISTSGVFDRIRRDRIEDLRVDGDILAIQLGCECHPDAFLWRDDRLVVDIVDGRSPPGNPFDQPLTANEVASDMVAQPPAVLPIILPDRRRNSPLESALPLQFRTARPNVPIEEAQLAVVSSLARAATEGIFDIPVEPLQRTFSDNGSEPESDRRVIGLSPVSDPMSELRDLFDTGDSPGLLLRSALTDAFASDRPVEGQAGTCLPEEKLDVPTWGDEREFAVQISERRGALTQEFDRYTPGAIEEYARTYIYFGFGAEARRVLMLDGGLTSERILLDELARIVDGDVVASGRIAGQIGCGGYAELWSMLAIGDGTVADDVIIGEAIRALRNLPRALREHLGPRLASVLIEAGFHERGQEVIDIFDQAGRPAPIEVELVRAELDSASGEPDAQHARLDTLAEDNARLPPGALAELLMLEVDAGEPPSSELIDLAEVYLHEARPSGGDEILSAAVVRAMIARSELAEAERVLMDTLPSGSVLFPILFNELHSAKVSSFPDREFLEIALTEQQPELNSNVEFQIASRLLEMGFPQQALDVLDRSAWVETEPDRRYLRATAFAKLGDVPSVDQILDGLSDDRARQIRIDARTQSGDYSGALEETVAGEDREDLGELAWRAGDWEVLELSEDDLLQSVSRLAQQPTFLTPNLAELEARSALLEESAQTRELAEGILERFSIDINSVEAVR